MMRYLVCRGGLKLLEILPKCPPKVSLRSIKASHGQPPPQGFGYFYQDDNPAEKLLADTIEMRHHEAGGAILA